MELKNHMEDLVFMRLDQILDKDTHICSCEKCRYDIAALALNSLPPRYFVTGRGQTFTKVKALEQQFNVDIIAALTNAIKIVKSQPHHHNENE